MAQKVDFRTSPGCSTENLVGSAIPRIQKKQISYSQNLSELIDLKGKKILYSISETAAITGMSYDFIAEKIRKSKITAVKFGDRPMIHRNTIVQILTEGVS